MVFVSDVCLFEILGLQAVRFNHKQCGDKASLKLSYLYLCQSQPCGFFVPERKLELMFSSVEPQLNAPCCCKCFPANRFIVHVPFSALYSYRPIK